MSPHAGTVQLSSETGSPLVVQARHGTQCAGWRLQEAEQGSHDLGLVTSVSLRALQCEISDQPSSLLYTWL